MIRLIGIAGLAIALLASTGAEATPCHEQLRFAREGLIPASATVRLDRMTAREALSLLGPRGERSLPLPIRRKVPDFWRYKARASTAPRDLRVSLAIDGQSGGRGVLRHDRDATQRIPVTVIAEAPSVLCSDGRYSILSGDIALEGLASDIGQAGSFALEIEIDVAPR